jgi:hypothetical protein
MAPLVGHPMAAPSLIAAENRPLYVARNIKMRLDACAVPRQHANRRRRIRSLALAHYERYDLPDMDVCMSRSRGRNAGLGTRVGKAFRDARNASKRTLCRILRADFFEHAF